MFHIIIAAAVWLLWYMKRQKNKLDILIRDSSAGKPIIRREIGRINVDKMGIYIYIPRTKEILPRFSDDYLYPAKGNRKFVDVTLRQECATTNNITYKEDAEKHDKGGKYAVNEYKYAPFLVSPVKTNARNFYFSTGREILEKTEQDKGFWDKHAAHVIALTMLTLTFAFCIVFLIFVVTKAPEHIPNVGVQAAQNASGIARSVAGALGGVPG